jgi:hypothetical protein
LEEETPRFSPQGKSGVQSLKITRAADAERFDETEKRA